MISALHDTMRVKSQLMVYLANRLDMFDPEMTSLAGGLPHPSVFPFLRADIEILAPTADLTPAAPGQDAASRTVSIQRDGPASQTTLSRAMQYSEFPLNIGVT